MEQVGRGKGGGGVAVGRRENGKKINLFFFPGISVQSNWEVVEWPLKKGMADGIDLLAKKNNKKKNRQSS